MFAACKTSAPASIRTGFLLAGLFLAGGASGGVPPEPTENPLDAHARYLLALAVTYEHGEGVGRDPVLAAAMYCEAARLGLPDAMHALGWMYANARGVARNDDYAATLFAMAAYLGHTQAANMATRVALYSGAAPACLNEPPVAQIEPEWSAEAHIGALDVERQPLARLVVQLAPDFQVSPRLALAVAVTESGLNPRAISSRQAMGVMQLIPDTAARFNVRDPFNPQQNVRGGLAYLRWLLAYFRGDVALVAAGYNAGERAVDRYRGVPPYPETRDYVRRILNLAEHRKHPYDPRVTEPSSIVSGDPGPSLEEGK